MNVLYLNTANKNVEIGLLVGDNFKKKNFEQDNNLLEVLDDKIEDFLRKEGLDFKDLTHLAVFEGPGGFTSLRIGVTMVNTMGQILKIPIVRITQSEEESIEKVIQKKIEKKDFLDQVVPFYGKEPNITKSKKML